MELGRTSTVINSLPGAELSNSSPEGMEVIVGVAGVWSGLIVCLHSVVVIVTQSPVISTEAVLGGA